MAGNRYLRGKRCWLAVGLLGLPAGACSVDDRLGLVVAPELADGGGRAPGSSSASGARSTDAAPTAGDAPADSGSEEAGATSASCPSGRCALALGQECRASVECASGVCSATASGDSVCCDEQCEETEVCGADGTGCTPASACATDDHRCSGSDYQRCAQGRWVTQTSCGALGCSLLLNGCLHAVGQACVSTSECGQGACLPSSNGDSICCTGPCDAVCSACNASGTACEDLPDDDACGVITCPADSTCRDYPDSVSTQRCVSGRCGSGGDVCPFTARAEGQACSANNLCDGAGACAAPKSPLGTACGSGAECGLGFCVDGVCCDQACDGPCETCAQSGQCRAPATDSSCPTVRCSGLASVCANQTTDVVAPRCLGQRQCEGLSACGLDDAGTSCVVGLRVGMCDGRGQCQMLMDTGSSSND